MKTLKAQGWVSEGSIGLWVWGARRVRWGRGRGGGIVGWKGICFVGLVGKLFRGTRNIFDINFGFWCCLCESQRLLLLRRNC